MYVFKAFQALVLDMLEIEPEHDPDLTNVINGWCRSRSVHKLTDFASNLPCKDEGSLRRNIILSCLLKKLDIGDVGLEAKTLEQFYDNELVCSEVNRRLASYSLKMIDEDPLVVHMRNFIAYVLGPVKNFLDSIPGNLRFTSGATATTSRSESEPCLKLRRRMTSTIECASFVPALNRALDVEIRPTMVNYSRLTTVPKDFKTRRTIACEPSLNLTLQLCFDTFVKKRLKTKTRVDLSSQLRNQMLATSGSVNGDLATIDLKAASDTVSYNIVAMLFPSDWFEIMNLMRTPYVYERSSRKLHKLSKFSSMGCGMTFTVETLLFLAAASACGDTNSCVYGDDIIVSTAYAQPVIELLEWMGFKTNHHKTHITGVYRESCGVHAIAGSRFKVFYAKELIGDADTPFECARLAHFVNGLKSICYGPNLFDLIQTIMDKNQKVPLVPFDFPSTSGFHSNEYNKTYSKAHHAYYCKAIVSKITFDNPKGSSKAHLKRQSVLSERRYYLWLFSNRSNVRKRPVAKSWFIGGVLHYLEWDYDLNVPAEPDKASQGAYELFLYSKLRLK